MPLPSASGGTGINNKSGGSGSGSGSGATKTGSKPMNSHPTTARSAVQCQVREELRRGRLPRPIFICCGSVGLILTVLGGIVLGVGRQRLLATDDYTFILVGSIVLGFGIILTVLAVFLSISWATLAAADYEIPGGQTSMGDFEDPEDSDDIDLTQTTR